MAEVQAKMAVVDHEGLDEPGNWAALRFQRAEAGPQGMLPSGWWFLPGVVLGLGLWTLIGIGVHAALTGGGTGAAELVTMAAPLADGVQTTD
jgi:hypothetical protein